MQNCSSNPCLHKYKPVEFQFNLEIERIVRRLRKKNRNLRVAVDMNDLQDTGNLNPHGERQPINGQKGQNGHNIQGQP